jgi:pimeloyl-ACP methyl ester carboxylesterase
MKSLRRWAVLVAVLTTSMTAIAIAADPFPAEDVAFTAKCDNSTQNYLLVRFQNFKEDEPHHLLILLHGYGSDRRQGVDQSLHEIRAAHDAAAARNMIIVSPDYRASTSWMGPKAEADLLQIIDELKARFRIGKVILAGASMGGSAALTFTAMHPELVDGIVSIVGTANHLEFESFQDAIKESFGGTKTEIPQEYKKRSAEYWPERFTMPIGITAGGKDGSVPPASVLRLAVVLKKLQPNVLLIYREAEGHNTNYEDCKAVFEFVLDRTLQTPAAP